MQQRGGAAAGAAQQDRHRRRQQAQRLPEFGLGGGSRIGRRNGAAPRRRISIHRAPPRCPGVWPLFLSSKGPYDSQPPSPFYIGSSPGVATKSGTIGPGLCSPPAPAAAGVRAPILAPAALGELTAN